MKRLKERAGFTLVELIVVIAILGILTAIAVPTYSGYVKKANSAADATLLDAINTAFAAACIENGVDINDVEDNDPDININRETGAWTYSMTANGENLNAAFEAYIGADKDKEFKVIEELKFEDGMFVDNSGSKTVKYGDQEIAFTLAQLSAIKNSNFNKLGAAGLVGQVDMATDILKQMLTNEESPDVAKEKVDALIMNNNNLSALATYMGYDPEDPAFEAVYFDLIEKKKAAMEAAGETNVTDETAMAAILSNNAVLAAATNSNLFDKNAFASQLANGTAMGTIMENMASDDSTNMNVALSQAAMAYGMYTSYAAKNDIDTKDMDMMTVIAALDDPAFREYMEKDAAADLNAYNAAMDMINTSAQNKTAVEDVLIKGFGNDTLKKMMTDALA